MQVQITTMREYLEAVRAFELMLAKERHAQAFATLEGASHD
jgi:hypothetical protein